MAADEDTELRDLVAQTLEANGVLGKIRAQLRSSVFLALEEQDSLQDKPMFVNKELKKFLSTKDGQVATGIVREFLEYFNMEFTLAVFDPESGCEKRSRFDLARDCGLPESDKPGKGPLLLQLMRANVSSSSSGESINQDLSDKDIAKAKARFQHYDLDHDGFVDRDELSNVFTDILPVFPRGMINGFLSDNYKKGDHDMTGYNEFLKIYKHLYSLCRSVVSNQPAATSQSPPSSPPKQHDTKSGDSTLERKNKKNKSETSEKSGKQINGEYEDSEPEEDPFFDDPVPKSKPKSDSSGAQLNKDIKAIDKRIADLAFDVDDDDDYDDDFNTNSNQSASKHSVRSQKSLSVGEELDESIEEDLSVEEKSVDDTTDQTVSINEVSGYDYVEDVSAALP